MEWIKDEHCRKKFFQELKKLWPCWLFDILLIIAVIGCIVYIILNINFQGNEIFNALTDTEQNYLSEIVFSNIHLLNHQLHC